jgi:hypothetical protein
MLPVPAGGVPEGVPNGDLRYGRHRRVLLRINYYHLSDDLELSKICSTACPF